MKKLSKADLLFGTLTNICHKLLHEKQSMEILQVVYVSSTLIHTIFVKHLKSLFHNH